MKKSKPVPEAVIHPLADGMVVTLSKQAVLKLRTGKTVVLEMLSGGKQIKFLLMRDSAWELKKKQLEKEKTD